MYVSHHISSPNLNLPVDLNRLKENLRMDDLAHADGLLMSIIMGCSRFVERTYGMSLLEQTVVEYWSAFPETSSGPMILRIQPATEITSITYINTSGTSTTWSADEYQTGRYNGQVFVIPRFNKSYPTPATGLNAITITYKAGFGTTVESVPKDVHDALILMATARYDRPDDPVMTLPTASTLLLHPYYRYN